jgi:hypothetical protein
LLVGRVENGTDTFHPFFKKKEEKGSGERKKKMEAAFCKKETETEKS